MTELFGAWVLLDRQFKKVATREWYDSPPRLKRVQKPRKSIPAKHILIVL